MMKRFHISSLLETLRYYAYGLYYRIDGEDVPLWAAAIAFKILVTFVPLLILLTGVSAYFIGQEATIGALTEYLRAVLPDYRTEQILRIIKVYSQLGTTLTVVGSAGLLLSAMTLFSTLRGVITNVFRFCHKPRAILHAHVFDFRMILQTGLLFTLSIGITLVVRVINVTGLEWIDRLGLEVFWLKAGWRWLFQVVGYVLPYALSTLVFFQFYYFIPRPYPPVRSALVGALTGAFLWEVLKNAFTYYLLHVASFERYQMAGGVDPTIRALTDFFVLLIVTVLWVYYSGLIFIIGGFIAHLHEMRIRPCPELPLPLRKRIPMHAPSIPFTDEELSV